MKDHIKVVLRAVVILEFIIILNRFLNFYHHIQKLSIFSDIKHKLSEDCDKIIKLLYCYPISAYMAPNEFCPLTLAFQAYPLSCKLTIKSIHLYTSVGLHSRISRFPFAQKSIEYLSQSLLFILLCLEG